MRVVSFIGALIFRARATLAVSPLSALQAAHSSITGTGHGSEPQMSLLYCSMEQSARGEGRQGWCEDVGRWRLEKRSVVLPVPHSLVRRSAILPALHSLDNS